MRTRPGGGIFKKKPGFLLLETMTALFVFSVMYFIVVSHFYLLAPAVKSYADKSIHIYNFGRFVSVLRRLFGQGDLVDFGSEKIYLNVYREKEPYVKSFCYRYYPALKELKLRSIHGSAVDCSVGTYYGLVEQVSAFTFSDIGDGCYKIKATIGSGYKTVHILCSMSRP